MKPIDGICIAGKVAGKKWLRRAKGARSMDRLNCQFETGKKVAIKLNVLSYAAT